MKSQQFAILLVIGSVYFATALQSSSNFNECTRGPAHWCKNLTNAKNCNAVRHCIQTVWEKQDVPEDHNQICDICLDMVKQARDQLESNETQNDLKAVFEGSCRLIIIKPIQKECIKLADDFIPELIEALASQMNPQVVCSVAGLCNSAKIDKMLEDAAKVTTVAPSISNVATTPKPNNNYERRALSCDECGYVSSIISTKFKLTSRDDILESFLNLCGHTGSFSDACANIALTYFKTFYNYLADNFDANGICHLSGTCVAKYHQHPEDVQIQNWSSVGVLSAKDDIPCELCQQLVHHLQEVLTANTTELEFKQVLEGLCKQTKGFKSECLSIIDQYYDQIYHVLVTNLDANGACFLIAVCPKGNAGGFLDQVDLKPLIPYIAPSKISSKISKIDKSDYPVYTKEQVNSMQLPIDLLTVHRVPMVMQGNAEFCTICEYFMHLLQETLAAPATDEKIKEAVNRVCDKFSSSIRGSCHNFVDMYGDAVIALLIQGINPREMCPRMDLCPKNIETTETTTTPQPKTETEKSTCPLCLFAVQQAQELIRDNKSKENIKTVLDNLCSHLSGKVKNECVDFVETYSNELVDMLITDFTPQQICVYIKQCTSQANLLDWENLNIDDEEIINDIFKDGEDSAVETEEVNMKPECLLCEKVISEAEKKMGPVKTKDDIEKELYKACGKLKKLADKCHKYVDEYGDKIAALILKEMTPKQICKELGYCSWKDMEIDNIKTTIAPAMNEKSKIGSPECAFCELFVKKLEDRLKDKKTEEEIKHEVEQICKWMPKSLSAKCDQFIETYGDLVIAMVQTVPPKAICYNLGLCPNTLPEKPHPVGDPTCIVCEMVISQLEKQLKDNATAADIKEALETVCYAIPYYADDCKVFVEKYGNIIISVAQTVPAKSLCQQIMLCSQKRLTQLSDQVVDCGVCHGATHRYATYVNEIQQDKRGKTHKTIIESVCNDLPARYYKKCSELFKYYGKSIRNLINRKTEQNKVCAKIGKCFEDENSELSYVKIL